MRKYENAKKLYGYTGKVKGELTPERASIFIPDELYKSCTAAQYALIMKAVNMAYQNGRAANA